MASKNNDSFEPQPLSMLPLIGKLVDDQLANAKQMALRLSSPPGVRVLNATTVTRLKRLWSEQLEMVPVHRKQFAYWRTVCNPTSAESEEIDRLESVITEHQGVCATILSALQ